MPPNQKQRALVVYDYGIFVVVSQIFLQILLHTVKFKMHNKRRARAKFSTKFIC